MDLEKKMKNLNRDLFILIIGHGRSGTTLCAGLLNQCPELNIALELNNNEITEENFRDSVQDSYPLSTDFNGNKVAIHHNLPVENFMYCLEKGLFIIHKEWKELKVIFTKRHHISTMVSRYIRIRNKGKKDSIEKVAQDYYRSEKTIKKLKFFFRDYLTFEFENAVGSELVRKSLFDHVGIKYYGIYSDMYGGQKQYRYGTEIRPENIQFGRNDLELELREKFENYIERKKIWPWSCISSDEFSRTYNWNQNENCD